MGSDLVYRFYFHGPAYQVVDEAWRSQRDRGGHGWRTTCPPTTSPTTSPR